MKYSLMVLMIGDEDILAWIALSLTNISFNKKELEYLSSPSKFLTPSGWNFSEIKNKIDDTHFKKLRDKLNSTKISDFQRYIDFLEDNKIELIFYSSKEYPQSLREIKNPHNLH